MSHDHIITCTHYVTVILFSFITNNHNILFLQIFGQHAVGMAQWLLNSRFEETVFLSFLCSQTRKHPKMYKQWWWYPFWSPLDLPTQLLNCKNQFFLKTMSLKCFQKKIDKCYLTYSCHCSVLIWKIATTAIRVKWVFNLLRRRENQGSQHGQRIYHLYFIILKACPTTSPY